jgi:predicted enzyme related to lactoylglutathione lyase
MPAKKKPAKPTAKKTPVANKRTVKKPAAVKKRRTAPVEVVDIIESAPVPVPSNGPVLRSIRSVIYQVSDLVRARAFYVAALGREPYFDQPFYIGFDVAGQELGLHPDLTLFQPGPGGAISYWRVDDIAATWAHLQALGGAPIAPPSDVGGGMVTAIVGDPDGNLIGLISGG